MRNCFDCIPCFFRQTLDLVRRLTGRKDLHEKALRGVIRAAGSLALIGGTGG